MTSSRKIYNAPWADQTPEGDLLERGPSPSTHVRHAAAFKQWAWRADALPSKVARSPGGDRIRAWMRPDGRHLRTDIPRRELEMYLYVFEHGRSVRWTARKLELHRGSVRQYLKRLFARMDAAMERLA